MNGYDRDSRMNGYDRDRGVFGSRGGSGRDDRGGRGRPGTFHPTKLECPLLLLAIKTASF